MSEGNIYLIHEFSGSNRFKVGVAKTPKKRKKELQTGNSDELIVVKTFNSKNVFKLEALLHRAYQSKHILGEWFELDMEDVKNFTQTCQKYEDLISFLLENNVFYR